MIIADTVKDMLVSYGALDFTDASKLSALPLDSLDVVQIMLELEKELHVELDATKLDGMVTVGDLVYYIESRIIERGHDWSGLPSTPICPSPGMECTCGYSELFWRTVNGK